MQASEQDLEHIIEQAARGDARAFEALHARFEQFVLKQVRARIYGPSEMAAGTIEEVAQDVWQTVHRQLADYDAARASFIRWLTVIAVRKAITHGKRLMLRRDAFKRWQESTDETAGLAAAPEHTVEAAELLEAVRDCTRRLHGREREVFQLARLEQMSIEHIAGLHGITPGRVRGALSDAHRKMLECLQQRGAL